ncbi:MAG: adenine deaminase [Flavisolibacter sp.]
MNGSFRVSGNLVDIGNKKIYPATVEVADGKIASISPATGEVPPVFLLPGFVDAHVHIESSMLIPSEFARLAVVHGTVSTVSDPHEIANVCGMAGVDFMIKNGNTVPFKFNFGAPSCVPATTFETAGATLSVDDVKSLMAREEILYLSEMMNFPGVLHGDAEVLAKIEAAKSQNKPVDGHAPGLRGADAKKYIDAGISTDHECFTSEEALDKLQHGMKVVIREGSAARNFEALIELLNNHPNEIMFCSDDKHPDSLVAGHINQLCARAVAKGIDLFKVLQAACVNPVLHYKLSVGLLRVNDPADFIVVKNLENFEVLQTYINGQKVAENGKTLIDRVEDKEAATVNSFDCSEKTVADLACEPGDLPMENGMIPVIEALDGQLITNSILAIPKFHDGNMVSDVEQDVLKMVVVNRYQNAPVAKAFIKNFGLKKGALASSVAHDSHNIVAVGVDDESLCAAINAVIRHRGGVSAANGDNVTTVPLPVAGLMSDKDGYEVAAQYEDLDKYVKAELGSTLASPFMTLSFMALLVIPNLKLSDLGLFNGDSFSFVK